MVGVVVGHNVETAELDAAMRRLGAIDLADLVFDVGALLESSTQRRIDEEKVGPDGEPWKDWSREHAATRRSSQSLLVGEGDLLGSIQNYSTGVEAKVGTNLVYGAIHQFGGDVSQGHPAIPARPYLGVSDRDEDDIARLVEDRLGELFQ